LINENMIILTRSNFGAWSGVVSVLPLSVNLGYGSVWAFRIACPILLRLGFGPWLGLGSPGGVGDFRSASLVLLG